jgi:hypothetical protein
MTAFTVQVYSSISACVHKMVHPQEDGHLSVQQNDIFGLIMAFPNVAVKICYRFGCIILILKINVDL